MWSGDGRRLTSSAETRTVACSLHDSYLQGILTTGSGRCRAEAWSGASRWRQRRHASSKKRLGSQRPSDGFSESFTAEESIRGEAGHVIAVVYEALDLGGQLRTEWDEGSTDGADWFAFDEIRKLPRVPVVDFVLGLLSSTTR